MTEDRDAAKYVAEQQNLQDQLVRKIYGPGVRFESLSAFGQHSIETLARTQNTREVDAAALLPSTGHSLDPRSGIVADEVEDLRKRLAEALRENEELWHENEYLRIELEDRG